MKETSLKIVADEGDDDAPLLPEIDYSSPRPIAHCKTPLAWTRPRRLQFLKHLSETGNVSKSAAQVGMPRRAAYRLRETDLDFADAWDEAIDTALDHLEETLMRRVIDGVDKPVFYGGKACGTTKSYPDALAMFLLKTRRPEIYGDLSAARKQQAVPPVTDQDNDDPIAALKTRLQAIEKRKQKRAHKPNKTSAKAGGPKATDSSAADA